MVCRVEFNSALSTYFSIFFPCIIAYSEHMRATGGIICVYLGAKRMFRQHRIYSGCDVFNFISSS